MQGPDNPDRTSSDPYGIELEELESPRDIGPEHSGQAGYPQGVSIAALRQGGLDGPNGDGKEPHLVQPPSPRPARPPSELEGGEEDRTTGQQERRSSR